MVRLILLAMLLLTACGDDPAPQVEVTSWAQVAAEQIAEAKKHGVPVTFENDLGMRFVLIPAGTFLMGSPLSEEGREDDEEQQSVQISNPYYLQVTEVTNAQFRSFRTLHESGTGWDDDRQPARGVSYDQALRFAMWLSQAYPGREYRLPTEAEWEHACRAGTTGRYYWGSSDGEAHVYENGYDAGTYRNDPDLFRDCRSWLPGDEPGDDGHRFSAPVASYVPGPWGLYDMLGNVQEWCSDWYDEFPWDAVEHGQTAVDPQGPEISGYRVVRSSYPQSDAHDLRCASRGHKVQFSAMHGPGTAGLRLVSPPRNVMLWTASSCSGQRTSFTMPTTCS